MFLFISISLKFFKKVRFVWLYVNRNNINLSYSLIKLDSVDTEGTLKIHKWRETDNAKTQITRKTTDTQVHKTLRLHIIITLFIIYI